MIALNELLNSDAYLKANLDYDAALCRGVIAGISSKSSSCAKDFLFVATKGATSTSLDGHDFINEAVGRGVKAVVVDHTWPYRPLTVPVIRAINSREALSYLCEGFYGWPSRGLKIIGITGTNGKTSTTFMLHSILKHAGLKAHVMGTLGFGEPGALSPLRHTTTEPEVLSACLSQQRKAGISHIAMEVSSHALAQKRVAAIHFAAVAFSNLTHEHLDFHQTMDNYRRAKESLFKLAHKEALKILPRDHPLDRAIDELPGIYLFDPNESLPVGLPLFGDFQKKNALLALHIAKALGIDDQSIALGLQSCPKIPGRLEPVFMTGPIVLVDFAHTPDALRNVLQALKLKKRGKLIVVFGCGGDRDQQKRPLMGNVVGELADRIYVTDDNPRNEDPKWIRAAILAGIKKTCDVYEIADRKCAIHAAIKSAAHEDVVLIAGKGHEQYQIVGRENLAFSDQKEALVAVEQLCQS